MICHAIMKNNLDMKSHMELTHGGNYGAKTITDSTTRKIVAAEHESRTADILAVGLDHLQDQITLNGMINVQVSGQPVSNQGDRSSYNKTGLIKINFMRPVLKNAYFLGLVSKT